MTTQAFRRGAEHRRPPRRQAVSSRRATQGHMCQPVSASGTPMEMQADLARLESAFPGFSFAIRKGWDGPRFEAWRDTLQSGLYAIITHDPCELLRELNMAVR